MFGTLLSINKGLVLQPDYKISMWKNRPNKLDFVYGKLSHVDLIQTLILINFFDWVTQDLFSNHMIMRLNNSNVPRMLWVWC